MATQINGNIFRKKLSPTFDKYLRLIVYRVEPTTPQWAPHQKSQLLGTRSVIWKQLEDEEGRGSDPGVSGKLETSGETARGCYLFCSCLTFLSLCLRLSEEVTHWSGIIASLKHNSSTNNSKFSQLFSILNFSRHLLTDQIFTTMLCKPNKICVQIMEHRIK